jgi:hypothetical protein
VSFDYVRAQRLADRQIRKFGMLCALRRSGRPDRQCRAVEADYTPQERIGGLVNPTDRLFLVSADSLAGGPPDQINESFVTFVPFSNPPQDSEVLRQIRPPGRLAPGGTVIYWELHVRG